MPNHVTTRCIVTGPVAEVDRFRQTVICVAKGDDIESLDFEKIIPMPTILEESSNWNDAELGIEILTGKPKPSTLSRSYLENPWIQKQGIDTLEKLGAWAEKERPDALEHGRKSIEAYEQTGFYDWYDWRVENWGTKWNTYSFEIEHEGPGELQFRFDTAWDFPRPIFEKLAEMFPTLCFECVCFDEMSNFAGRGAFNGEPRFEYMEATDELFEAVYGYKPK
jgi:Api92-like protein with ferredoxin domain